MLPQPQNSSVIYNGKIVDTWAKLPQAHMLKRIFNDELNDL
jgi:hypothetical protein